MAVILEAVGAAGMLARGARKEFRGEAKGLTACLLDKLKDKTTNLIKARWDPRAFWCCGCNVSC